MGALGEGAPGRKSNSCRDPNPRVHPACVTRVQKALWIGAGQKGSRSAQRRGVKLQGHAGQRRKPAVSGGTLSRGVGRPDLRLRRIGSGIGAENGLQEGVRAE